MMKSVPALAGGAVLLALVFMLNGCSSDGADIDIPDLSIADDKSAKPVKGEFEREADLKLTLGAGARFPLRKTISQRLVQKSPAGDMISSSTLALTFAITVEKEEEGRRLLDVVYQRAKFSNQHSHKLLGENMSYDSAKSGVELPESFQVYRGLVGNGFKFWLGAKNRIVEVVEFDEFLKRTVRFASEERQPILLQHIVATQKDEGFSNFVDDSIGLLPYRVGATGEESRVKVGDTWKRERKIMRPLPMTVYTTYEVTKLREKDATISILGRIYPVTSTETSPNSSQAKEVITLDMGHAVGSCTIDLETGLPLRSQVDRMLDMTVHVPGHEPYKQKKTVSTTIEAFPTSPDTIYSETAEPEVRSSPIQQAGGEKNARSNRDQKVGPAKFELETP
jgi:hypothetical protein